jgi:hypothetical protein
MKKIVMAGVIAAPVLMYCTADAATLEAWDFTGATATATSNTKAATTYDSTALLQSTLTRSAPSGGSGDNNNAFRWIQFKNDGVSTSNNDYFQFTITANTGYAFSVASIYGNFNGTSSFSASPGVTMAYAYSLDGGSTFTLMGTFTQIGAGNATYTLTSGEAAALSSINAVTFRFYASGQTTTGGWGYQSAASAGTIGLQVNGITFTAVPEPHEYALGVAGLLGLVILVRRRKVTKFGVNKSLIDTGFSRCWHTRC